MDSSACGKETNMFLKIAIAKSINASFNQCVVRTGKSNLEFGIVLLYRSNNLTGSVSSRIANSRALCLMKKPSKVGRCGGDPGPRTRLAAPKNGLSSRPKQWKHEQKEHRVSTVVWYLGRCSEPKKSIRLEDDNKG